MILDGDIGDVIKCDRCGRIHDHAHGEHEIKQNIWDVVFKGRIRPDELYMDYCRECAVEITPVVFQLRDVDELRMYVNKLRAAINERKKRNQDDRTTS